MSRILQSIHELKQDEGEIINPIRFVSINKKQEVKAKSRIWLISMTDLMSLIFAFFVMLYSMSEHNFEHQKLSNADVAGAEKLDQNQVDGAPLNAGAVDDISLNKIGFNRALDLSYLKNILETFRKDNPVLAPMQIANDSQNGRIILILPEELLFASGQSSLSPKGDRALGELVEILSNIKNGVEVIGHSDPRPRRDGKSNMMLSLERARAVASVLERKGYPHHVNYQGYGSALFDSLPASWTDAQKLSTARRVDIVVHAHDGSRLKRFGIASP